MGDSPNKLIGAAWTPMLYFDKFLYHRIGGLWFLYEPSRLSYEKVPTKLDEELEAFYQSERGWH